MAKIVIACDSFKGSLSSAEAGEACALGIREVMPEAEVCVIEVADGGEGTCVALGNALGCNIVMCHTFGPLMRPLLEGYGICDDLAVIDIATASGLTLLSPEERNPVIANTFGTGTLIKDAVGHGCRRIMLGLGGSATVDGGIGMLQALGVRFLDENGKELKALPANLHRVEHIDVSRCRKGLFDIEITILSDVDNPLCGAHGAAAVFGPQKGADADCVRFLDDSLHHYAEVLQKHSGKDILGLKGGGAAGGVAAAIVAMFPRSRIVSGAEAVLDAVKFDEVAAEADLVITGEGRLDAQTLNGKVPMGVLRRCIDLGVDVAAIGGTVDGSVDFRTAGFCDVEAAMPDGMSIEQAMERDTAVRNIAEAAERIVRRRPG